MDKLWPLSAQTDTHGELWIGSYATSALAGAYGTPLYVFDEETLRSRRGAYCDALARHYPGTAQAAYASKAYLCTAIAQLFDEEGLDLDVVWAASCSSRSGLAFRRNASTSTATTSRGKNCPRR